MNNEQLSRDYSVLLAYPGFHHTYFCYPWGVDAYAAVEMARNWASEDCGGEYGPNEFTLLAAMEGRITLTLTNYDNSSTLCGLVLTNDNQVV